MIIHILNHHVWPDGSANCLYAEQLALSLKHLGYTVRLVGGSGSYRKVQRQRPEVDVIQLKTEKLSRNQPFSLIREYWSVFQAYRAYVQQEVSDGDMVIASSDPFFSLWLIDSLSSTINRVLWLTDYFPDGLVSVHGYYRFVYPFRNWLWNRILRRWDVVIKIAGNLHYDGNNAIVFRLWPTIASINKTARKPKKWALYSGNMGYVHDLEATVKNSEKLYQQGYEIHFYADGPKVKDLPNWIKRYPIVPDDSSYVQALYDHEIHLIAGTVRSDGGSFPSKIWNSIASGRKIIPCGFFGAMLQEYDEVLKSDYKSNLSELTEYIVRLINKR